MGESVQMSRVEFQKIYLVAPSLGRSKVTPHYLSVACDDWPSKGSEKQTHFIA